MVIERTAAVPGMLYGAHYCCVSHVEVFGYFSPNTLTMMTMFSLTSRAEEKLKLLLKNINYSVFPVEAPTPTSIVFCTY